MPPSQAPQAPILRTQSAAERVAKNRMQKQMSIRKLKMRIYQRALMQTERNVQKVGKSVLIWNPYHPSKLAWDHVILALLVFSALSVPFQTAFNQKGFTCSGTDYVVEVIIDSLFVLDVLVHFRTAYFAKQGFQASMVTDWKKIALHYLDIRLIGGKDQGGFFWFDLVGSIPLDSVMCGSSQSTEWNELAKAPRMMRAARLLRLLRLLRLMRIKALAYKVKDYLHVNPALMSIISFFAWVAILSHWVACFWFFLGTLMDEDPALWEMETVTKPSWSSRFSVPSDSSAIEGMKSLYCVSFQGRALDADCQEAEVADQYFVSLYWAVTSLCTVGYGDIQPVTSVEQIFTILVMITGSFLFGQLVARLTPLLDRLNPSANAHRMRMLRLEQFMSREKLPPLLRSKIRIYFSTIYSTQRNIPLFLGELSGSLKRDMYLRIFKDVLQKVSFLRNFSDSALINLIHRLKYVQAPAGEVIYREGSIGDCMYLLHHGEIEMTVGDGSQFHWVMEEGSFFGENTLIGKVHRVATAKTRSWCHLFALSKQAVEDTCAKYPQAGQALVEEVMHVKKKFKKPPAKSKGSAKVNGNNKAKERKRRGTIIDKFFRKSSHEQDDTSARSSPGPVGREGDESNEDDEGNSDQGSFFYPGDQAAADASRHASPGMSPAHRRSLGGDIEDSAKSVFRLNGVQSDSPPLHRPAGPTAEGSNGVEHSAELRGSDEFSLKKLQPHHGIEAAENNRRKLSPEAESMLNEDCSQRKTLQSPPRSATNSNTESQHDDTVELPAMRTFDAGWTPSDPRIAGNGVTSPGVRSTHSMADSRSTSVSSELWDMERTSTEFSESDFTMSQGFPGAPKISFEEYSRRKAMQQPDHHSKPSFLRSQSEFPAHVPSILDELEDSHIETEEMLMNHVQKLAELAKSLHMDNLDKNTQLAEKDAIILQLTKQLQDLNSKS